MQGLIWPSVNLDKAEISLEWQVQRVGRELIHKQHLKTDGSTDVLPLPDICLAAVMLQRKAQDRMRARLEQGGGTWPHDGLVFTTRTGRAIEPRAVSRRFDLRAPSLACGTSASMTPAAPAAHSSRRSTCTRVWPCRS